MLALHVVFGRVYQEKMENQVILVNQDCKANRYKSGIAAFKVTWNMYSPQFIPLFRVDCSGLLKLNSLVGIRDRLFLIQVSIRESSWYFIERTSATTSECH